MKLPTAIPGVLSACKQMRAEALPIFLTENQFKFDADLVRNRCVANWVRGLGPHGARLSKLVLEVMCPEEGRTPTGDMQQVWKPETISIHWSRRSERWKVGISGKIRLKAKDECAKLDTHEKLLLKQVQDDGMPREEALLEFVWSDWLADVVFRCDKGR